MLVGSVLKVVVAVVLVAVVAAELRPPSAARQQQFEAVVRAALIRRADKQHPVKMEPGNLCAAITAMGSYPCEFLNATTADGFVLNVVHIPPRDPTLASAVPVVLQHGLLMTAMTYFGNPQPELNLATILHEQGYDVYMPNSRGNHYSSHNLRFPEHNATYWQMIDWDEMAAFDVPAVIDMVLGHSNRTTNARASTVTWVGHSEGTCMMFAAMSTSARAYAAKINLFVALAPVAYVGNTTSELLRLAVDWNLAPTLQDLDVMSFLEDDGLVHLVADVCPDLGDFCAHMLGAVLGYGNNSNFDPKIYPYVTQYTPGGTSVSNLIHWAQMVKNANYAMHDFGEATNMQYYHQPTAPVYNLSNFPATLPTVLVSGGADALADPLDVARLVAELPAASVVSHINVPNYAHMDFVWGLDAHVRIYPQILQLIAKYARA